MPTRGMMEAAGKKELAATLTLALTPNP